MRWAIVLGVVGVGATARAAPTCLPSSLAPIVYDPATDRVWICDGDGAPCPTLDPVSGKVEMRGAGPPRAEGKTHLGAKNDAVCTGAGDKSCIALGSKATAAIAAALAENRGAPYARWRTFVTLSEDKAFAFVRILWHSWVWDLARDREVVVKSWIDDAASQPVAAGLIGALVVFRVTRRDMQTESRLFARDGAPVGKPFEGVGPLLPLGAGVAAALGEGGGVVRIATKGPQVTVWNDRELQVDHRGLFARDGAVVLVRDGVVTDGGVAYEVVKLDGEARTKVSSFMVPHCAP